MLKSLVFTFSLISLTLAVSACSNSSRNNGEVKLCDQKWSPISTDNSSAQEKVDTSDDAKSISIPAGEYETPSIRLVYYDQQKDIRLDLSISPNKINQKTNSVSFSFNCVGGKGLRPQMDPLTIQLPYVAKMVVGADNSSRLSTHELTVSIDFSRESVVLVENSVLSSDQAGSLKNTYPKNANTQHIIYKINSTDYESRVKVLSEGAQLISVINYRPKVESSEL